MHSHLITNMVVGLRQNSLCRCLSGLRCGDDSNKHTWLQNLIIIPCMCSYSWSIKLILIERDNKIHLTPNSTESAQFQGGFIIKRRGSMCQISRNSLAFLRSTKMEYTTWKHNATCHLASSLALRIDWGLRGIVTAEVHVYRSALSECSFWKGPSLPNRWGNYITVTVHFIMELCEPDTHPLGYIKTKAILVHSLSCCLCVLICPWLFHSLHS